MQGFSNLHLKWSTKLLRLTFEVDAGFLRPTSEVECQVAQTRAWPGTRSYSDLDTELLKLASNAGLLRPASEVVQNATFVLK